MPPIPLRENNIAYYFAQFNIVFKYFLKYFKSFYRISADLLIWSQFQINTDFFLQKTYLNIVIFYLDERRHPFF